jgi:hypothetical protein
MQKSFIDTILAPKFKRAASVIANFINEQRSLHLDQKLAAAGLSIFLAHVKLYKKLRQEIINDIPTTTLPNTIVSDSPLNTPSNIRQSKAARNFLTVVTSPADFNSSAGSSSNTTSGGGYLRPDLNDLILKKLQASNNLHHALENRETSEKEHLRSWVKQLAQLFDMLANASPSGNDGSDGTGGNLVKLFAREWVACQLVHPMLQRLSDPRTINGLIVSQAQQTLKLQKAVKSYRGFLDSHFSAFPASYLPQFGKGFLPNSAPFHEKIR